MSKLSELYNIHKAYCCKCGCKLESVLPLGSVFVLDKDGNYYCINCDEEFEDGDERIYEDWMDEE